MIEKQDFNMMTILKGAIGKELTKITMPVHFNEVGELVNQIRESQNGGLKLLN